MRVPLQWLADYVDIDLTVEELATRLTMTGLKVESIERIGSAWHDVIIGQLAQLEPHPSSRNPLWVTEVDLGERTVTIVTGAQNLHTGDKVPVVLVGGLLPVGPGGEPLLIQAKPMAGITSEGMLASERELGISDEHSGIFVLPPHAPVGTSLRNFMGDDVLDIETNPNRPDTLSIIGIAREVAAFTAQQLSSPRLDSEDGVEWLDQESVPVRVEAPALCPRYSALRIEGSQVGESPFWLRNRLEAAGVRAINSLVDITNYVMMEYGQPMHAFDASSLRGGEIVVRRAHHGEQLRTLDGVNRTLSSDDLVISGGERAVGLAGVMGGENSEVTEDTTAIILEAATFDSGHVRRTAQALGLRTEASSRFEKGLPPEQTVLALERYVQLLAQVAGSTPRVARISDAWVGPPPARSVTMPYRDLERLVGMTITPEKAAETLSLLGFGVTADETSIEATVPYWRREDIQRSADLVEEVARLVGYDTIPCTLPNRTMPPPAPLPEMYWDARVRERLLAAGVNETTTHSLTSPESMGRLLLSDGSEVTDDETWAQLVPHLSGVYVHEALTRTVSLMNPATRDRRILRLTLLPSVLDVLARNVKHTSHRLAHFEMGNTFFARPQEDLPYERRTLALVLSGERKPRSWQQPQPGPYSFYDMKGMVEAVLEEMNISGWSVQPTRHAALHPGRGALVRLGGHDVGYFGQLHPLIAQRFAIEGWPVQVAELDLDALIPQASERRTFHALPRYPSARRDIAVVVDREVPAGEAMRIIKEAGGDSLESAQIFDVYTGDPLETNQKSIAVAMEFRAPDATLTQDEVGAIMDRMVDTLARDVNATLRE